MWLAPDRVDAVAGLIEHEQARGVDESLGEADALQHAFGIFAEAKIVGALFEADQVENFRDAAAARGGVHAGESAVEIKHVAPGHVSGEAVVLGKIPDGAAGFGVARVPTEDQGAAGGGVCAGEQHLDEGGLAGAVGSEKAVGGADRDANGDVVDGAKLAAGEGRTEDFGQAFGFDGVGWHSFPFRAQWT